jgi:hypothetical protein
VTDIFDQATEREEKDRALALQLARNAPQRDYAAEVCNGCQYATKASWGKTCDGWKDCLQDLQRRERTCRAS